jgi:GNAT superfamily N-acetyltransferase
MTPTLRIARAADTPENLRTIIGLREEASAWLSGKGTDQWQKPWPNRRRRDARIRRGLKRGATWIVRDEAGRAVATVSTATAPKSKVWREAECDLSVPAVYAHGLIVTRDFAGWGLGAELIDWTGLRGHRDYGAEWIRIDVWSSNLALHEYYTKRGFTSCGVCPDRRYPSGMLFQKNVLDIAEPERPLFAELELPAVVAPPAGRGVASGDSCPPVFLDEEYQASSRSWRRRAASLSRSS